MNQRTKKSWIMLTSIVTALVLLSCTAMSSVSTLPESSTVSREAVLLQAQNTRSTNTDGKTNPSGIKKNPKSPTAALLTDSTTTQTSLAMQTTTAATTSPGTTAFPTTATLALPTTTAPTTTTATLTTTTLTQVPTTAATTAEPTTAAPTTTWTTAAPTTTATAAPTTMATTTAAPTTTATTAAPTTAATTTTPATTAPTTTATTAAPTTTATTTSAVSVKTYGALGNGSANDTAAIQRAFNTGAPVISIPDGTYMIDSAVGLKPLSNQTIQLSANAILKVIPNSNDFYQLIRLESVANVEISGGRLLGDRYAHTGSSGEHGMGIVVSKYTDNIRIRNMTISNFWGDGIYVGSDTAGVARNVLIENVTCDGNRRQGLSITQAEYVTVRNSTFKNTSSIAPQAGIDIEPNAGGHVNNVTIKGNQFSGNAGYGLVINGAAGQYVRTVSIDSNWFTGNVIGISDVASTTDISLVIPYGTTRIGDYAYSECYALSRVTIPSTVTEIGADAFMGCSRLANVTIPNGVTRIGLEAFKYCTSLTSVNIPASVTTIDNWAFIGCRNLHTAYFYGNAPVTTNYLFYNAASDFKVYFIAGKTGFTSPTWRGYPSATFVP